MPSALSETVEQKVRLQLVTPEGGTSCEVKAVFRGDKDNCANHDAHGRDNCLKETGCVCSRQEKHVSWEMEGGHKFGISFDQGDASPFVREGSSECTLSSNKKGKLRCRVKGKDTPKGIYRYSISSPGCTGTTTQLKLY